MPLRTPGAHRPRPPRALLGVPAAGLVALLLLWCGATALERIVVPTTGPVYSVASLHAALAGGQAGLLDRPLRVRAVAGVCTTWVSRCLDWQPVLVDDPRGAPVPISWRPTLLTRLRRLPLVGRFLPAPQPVRWGVPAVYRVAVHLVATACGAPVCLRADLLDAAQPTE